MKTAGMILICAILTVTTVTGIAEEAGSIPSIRETMQTQEQTVPNFSFRNHIFFSVRCFGKPFPVVLLP